MSVLVENREAKELMERLAQKIRKGATAWRGGHQAVASEKEIREAQKTISAWRRIEEDMTEFSDLPRGLVEHFPESKALEKLAIYAQGKRSSPLRSKNRNYAQDAAIATDDLLNAAKDEDARHWAAGLNIHVDIHDPVNQLAWHVLGDHIRRSPHGAVVGELDQKLVKATLQALVKNTFAQDDAEKEQAAIHNFEREENTAEPWEKYIHPEADSREWLGELADRFDMNAIGARGHWSRLRDNVLRSATGSKVRDLDRMLLRDTLRRLHDDRKGE